MHYQSLLITHEKNFSPGIPDLAGEISVFAEHGFELNTNNPDIFELKQTKETIKIEFIRKLIEWVNKKPFQNSMKLAVIRNAEKMTVQAQNSLLKTLEEPPNNTVIVLFTNNSRLLLPTIVSRTDTRYLKRTIVVEEEVSKTPKNLGQKFLYADYMERLQLIEEWVGAHLSREELTEILQSLISEIITEKGISDTNTAQSMLKYCTFALSGVHYGANLRLTLETLAISI